MSRKKSPARGKRNRHGISLYPIMIVARRTPCHPKTSPFHRDSTSPFSYYSPKIDIGMCHCERREAISHCYTEIAAHPSGARNDGHMNGLGRQGPFLGYSV